MQIESDPMVRSERPDRYDVKAVEKRWQIEWERQDLYSVGSVDERPKFYCLEQFPYPSGHLHMGHVRVYTLGDIIARYRRMSGHRVLHPMGWDAFGLPAENAAIKSGVSPRISTLANIAYMKTQMRQMGLSFDWSHEVTTSEPEYYRYTQELFLLFYERGLAYQKAGAVNWCPSCETVLANEQVEEGLCWRCEAKVVKRDLTQWYFRITDYAQRLLEDLEGLDWPQEIVTQQRNWIGRSVGAEVRFAVPLIDDVISVFSTRPDTLYGATYVVLAPEHPLVERLVEGRKEEEAVKNFVAEERVVSDIERTAENTDKRGIFTGAYAEHPLTGAMIPIWVGNYVLSDYGTGAVMGVPAHDHRDYRFAQKYDLPMRRVVAADHADQPSDEAYTGGGILMESDRFNGMDSDQAKSEIAALLAQKNRGGPRITYRMRDWLISRQRFWGAPIPIVHCSECGTVPVPLAQLPVLLPDHAKFTGRGQSPLAQLADWVETTCPQCGHRARRETDTMDTFVDSSWYYYRYTSPSSTSPFDPKQAAYWMAVDEYVGGKEHAVLHLLYSRFFTKVLYDAGLVSVVEPFRRLLSQGMVVYRGKKMSKSKGNTLSPESIMAEWGSDATRVFILFAAPPEKDFEWSEQGVEGAYRFLQRVYRLAQRSVRMTVASGGADDLMARVRARTVHKVTDDLERRSFNTAVSALMEYTNSLYQNWEEMSTEGRRAGLETLVVLLAPFAPHLADELWHDFGHEQSVHLAVWPNYDAVLLVDPEVEVAVQINGKVRFKVVVPAELNADGLAARVLAEDRLRDHLNGRSVAKVIAIPGRLVNVVVR